MSLFLMKLSGLWLRAELTKSCTWNPTEFHAEILPHVLNSIALSGKLFKGKKMKLF